MEVHLLHRCFEPGGVNYSLPDYVFFIERVSPQVFFTPFSINCYEAAVEHEKLANIVFAQIGSKEAVTQTPPQVAVCLFYCVCQCFFSFESSLFWGLACYGKTEGLETTVEFSFR